MSKKWIAIIAATALSVAAPPSHAGRKGWDDASKIATDALVVTALGVPAVQRLERPAAGRRQHGGRRGRGGRLEGSLSEWRPDHSDRKSFPSGHTSVSFAAAATLQKRYGW